MGTVGGVNLIKLQPEFLFGWVDENEALFRAFIEKSQNFHEKKDEVVFYKGVNALQTYGLGNASLMDENGWDGISPSQ